MTHTHFAYGWINPAMGFGFALAGSFLGLTCMVQARNIAKGPRRNKWLLFGALAIGGTGIWMMHFIAMIGFTVTGSDVRYDVAITVASLLISIVSVGLGLFIVGKGDPTVLKIAIGGVITGLGVVSMHYTGMAAVNIAGTIHYDPQWVIASVVIALVAATVALFFTTWVRGRGSLAFASIVMAIAVCGMHYTGMGAVSVDLNESQTKPVDGYEPLLLLIPILILATIVLIGLIFGVLGERDDIDRAPAAKSSDTDDARLRSALLPPTNATPSFWDTELPATAAARETSRVQNPVAPSHSTIGHDDATDSATRSEPLAQRLRMSARTSGLGSPAAPPRER